MKNVVNIDVKIYLSNSVGCFRLMKPVVKTMRGGGVATHLSSVINVSAASVRIYSARFFLPYFIVKSDTLSSVPVGLFRTRLRVATDGRRWRNPGKNHPTSAACALLHPGR